MSEKRFEMGESDIQGEMTFIDTETNKIYWQEYFDEIVDLINEQQATIEQLVTKCSRLAKEKDELSDDWSDKVGRLLDFVEEQGQVSRQDIKDWWNNE